MTGRRGRTRRQPVGLRSAIAFGLAIAAAVACAPWGGAPGDGGNTSVASVPPQLYLARYQQLGTHALTRLDPLTLADLPDEGVARAAATPSPARLGMAVSSRDGKTLASMPDSWTLLVQDGASGAERARIQTTLIACCPHLSEDGGRVAVFTVGAAAKGAVLVLDTGSGTLLTAAPLDELGWQSKLWLDPALRYLYHGVLSEPSGRRPHLEPLRLVRHDLATGAEVGRLELPAVRVGAEPLGRTIRGMPAHRYLVPGVALQPDGRRLAVLHAAEDAVTLVDTERFGVERTVALRREQGLLGWLPWPRVAEAKMLGEGSEVKLTYAPDGRHAYLFGLAWNGDEQDPWNLRGLGVRRVDLERGTVLAEALAGEPIDRVLVSPDERSLYTYGPAVLAGPHNTIASGAYTLRRLDAATLAVLAERTVPGWGGPVLRPNLQERPWW